MASLANWIRALRGKAKNGSQRNVAEGQFAARQPKKMKAVELSTRGLSENYGVITEEYQTDLATLADRLDIYDQMRHGDASCATVEKAITMPIRSAKWYVTSADNSQGEMIEELEKNFFGGLTHSWDTFMREALTSTIYGFAVFEKVWETTGNGVRLRKLPGRNPKTTYRWWFDDTYGLAGWEQEGYWLKNGEQVYQQVKVPIEKLLVLSYGEEWGNPEGRSVYRPAYGSWMMKKRLATLACIRCERAAGGMPVGGWAEGEDPSEADTEKFQQMLSRIRTHEQAGIVLGPGMTLTDLDLSADVPFQGLLEYFAQEILRTSLAPFFGMGQGANTGTYNLADRLLGFFLDVENTIADWLASEFSMYVVQPWVNYNYGPQEVYPCLQHSDLRQKTSLTELAKLVATVFDPNLDLGTRLPEIDAFMRDELRLPARQLLDRESPQPKVRKTVSVAKGKTKQAEEPVEPEEESNDTAEDKAAAATSKNKWSDKTRGILGRMNQEYRLAVEPFVQSGDLAAAVKVKVPLTGALEASFRADLASTDDAFRAPVLAEMVVADMKCGILNVDTTSIFVENEYACGASAAGQG